MLVVYVRKHENFVQGPFYRKYITIKISTDSPKSIKWTRKSAKTTILFKVLNPDWKFIICMNVSLGMMFSSVLSWVYQCKDDAHKIQCVTNPLQIHIIAKN